MRLPDRAALPSVQEQGLDFRNLSAWNRFRLTWSKDSLRSSRTLHVRDIHVEYGRRVAISGISLDIAPAQIVSLVGSNGAGKTSTLRAIMGLRAPSRGEISFGDVRIDRLSPPDIVAQGIALSPEGRRVFPRMTMPIRNSPSASARHAGRRRWNSPLRAAPRYGRSGSPAWET
jgi:ABC-type branched-subunit amino acid transport system ATPase component